MQIYIACALTHVPREFFEQYAGFIHQLAIRLKDRGLGDPKYALVSSDPQLAAKPLETRARLCYLWDRELVQQSDIVIAEASFPSIGLGIELQIADAAGIPVILSFRRGSTTRVNPVQYTNPDQTQHTLQIGEGYVSLMALGLPAVFKVISYESEEEGLEKIIDAVTVAQNASI